MLMQMMVLTQVVGLTALVATGPALDEKRDLALIWEFDSGG